MRVQCEKYKASFMSAATCITRVKQIRTAKQGQHWRSGLEHDPGCAACETGNRLYDEFTMKVKNKRGMKMEIKMKKCAKCGEKKPMDMEHFYKDAKNKKHGLSSWCRACQRKCSNPQAYQDLPLEDSPEAPAIVIENPADHAIGIEITGTLEETLPMLLTLDFEKHELLYQDILAEADDQLRTPDMQAMCLISKALYSARNERTETK